jgi:tetratricopeptide (TPR) repeat protein
VKWLFGILLGALILIGLGLGLLGNDHDVPVSENSKAMALYKEGTEDVLAYCNSAAIKKLEKALELDPNLVEAKISLVSAQGRMGHNDLAKEILADADSLTSLIVDDKRRMVAQLRLSDLGQQNYRSIRDSLITSLHAIQPENLHLLISQANSAYAEDDNQKAETLFLKVLDIYPNYAGSYNMLGYMELRSGNFEKAIEYMQKYAFLAPRLANPHDSMGEVLMVIGRYEEAEKEFRTSISMQPDFYSSLISLGTIHIDRGQMETGVKILEDLGHSVAGTDIEKAINMRLVSAYHTIGKTDLLSDATARYISKYPEDYTTCLYRGIRLAYMGKSKEGQAVVDSCVTSWREYPGFHTRKDLQARVESMARSFDALVAELDGEYATAVRMWSRVEELNRVKYDIKERWRTYYYLARALRLNGEPAKALEQVALVLQTNSRQIQALTLAADCYLDLNQTKEARKIVDQLRWSLQWADEDYPAFADLQRLELVVSELEGNS